MIRQAGVWASLNTLRHDNGDDHDRLSALALNLEEGGDMLRPMWSLSSTDGVGKVGGYLRPCMSVCTSKNKPLH